MYFKASTAISVEGIY